MRLVYGLILLFLLGAVGVFAVQNREIITLNYLDRRVTCPVSLLVVIAYLLGMVSGWTVLGIVRRSLRRITEHPTQ